MSENSVNKELFFHVGLAKTGSTYLQNKFFHKLEGIKYIHTSKFYKYERIISQSNEKRLLFSREFDRQFFDETAKIANLYPNAKIIIVLRSNEQWIASQYRRYVKNGGSKDINEFIDITDNKGVWKNEEALFFPKLEFLKQHFKNLPLVLFFEDFKKNPHQVFQKIADYTGTEYHRENVSLKAKHKSYSEKQLLFVRRLVRKYKILSVKYSDNQSWLQYRSRWFLLHIFLYIAKLLPLNLKEELIKNEQLDEYKSFFIIDWEQCKVFAKEKSAL